MDERIFHLINQQWTNPFFDFFMPTISRADLWWPFFLAAGIALCVFGGFRGRAFVLCTLVTLALTNLVVDPLKAAIGRPRPKQVQPARVLEMIRTQPKFLTVFHYPLVRLSTPEERAIAGSSFPSGHTNNNTVIAVCAALFYRRRGLFYCAIALAVMYSRVYLAAHWPSDILATFFLALGETLIILALAEWLWRKLIVPRFPGLGSEHPVLWSTALP